MVETLIHPEVGDKLGDPAETVHEKRKTLKKAQVGEGVFTALTGLLLPLLTDIITNKKRKLDSV